MQNSWKERTAEAQTHFPCLISAQGNMLACKLGEVGVGLPCAQPPAPGLLGPWGAAASVARRGQPAAAVQNGTSHPWQPAALASSVFPGSAALAAWTGRNAEMDCQELRQCVAPLSPSPHVLCLMMSSAMRASLWLSAFAAPDLFALGPACFQAAKDREHLTPTWSMCFFYNPAVIVAGKQIFPVLDCSVPPVVLQTQF